MKIIVDTDNKTIEVPEGISIRQIKNLLDLSNFKLILSKSFSQPFQSERWHTDKYKITC